MPSVNAQDFNFNDEDVNYVNVCYNEEQIPEILRNNYVEALDISREVFAEANIQLNYNPVFNINCIEIDFKSRVEEFNEILGVDQFSIPSFDTENMILKDLVSTLDSIQVSKEQQFVTKRYKEFLLEGVLYKSRSFSYLHRVIGYAHLEDQRILVRPYVSFVDAYLRVDNNFKLEDEEDVERYHTHMLARTINHELGHILGLIHVNSWANLTEELKECLVPFGPYSEGEGNLMSHTSPKHIVGEVPDIRFSSVQKNIMTRVIKEPSLQSTFFKATMKRILSDEELDFFEDYKNISTCVYKGRLFPSYFQSLF